jgi:hypothetical protein
MSKKNFKIARRPGQGNGAQAVVAHEPERKARAHKSAPASLPASASVGLTTRKTIEVPEDYFFRVKMRALERKMLEKELWAEILGEYFENHPTA